MLNSYVKSELAVTMNGKVYHLKNRVNANVRFKSVGWEHFDFCKGACKGKVATRFEGKHPVPFYKKGRW